MRAEQRQWVWAALAVLVPWSWFAVRNLAAVFDLVATGLPVLYAGAALGLFVYAALRRRRRLSAGIVSCLLAGAVAVAGPWRAEPAPPPLRPFRIVAANVNSKNSTIQRAVADALAQQGDVVLLIEAGREQVTPPTDYPTVIRPKYTNQLILSRFPARLLDKPGNWPKDFRAHRLEVDAPAGRVVVYLVHLKRPHVGPRRIWSIRGQVRAQRREQEAVLASARTETAPVIVAGDFNTSDRSRAYRRITGRFRDALRAERAGPTYVATLWRPFLLRIDHIFVPRDWCASQPERFRLHGSDHRGLAVDVGPCPAL
jgi:endonuclease/exonuclease/phosphatase (EEP) superfamily protein YafD